MRFRFKSKRLYRLYTEEYRAHKYPESVVEAFFELMAIVSSAADERDLYALKSLRYEKLKGRRQGQRSLRLNEQFRLIVEWEEDEEGKYLVIVSIEDYH